MTIQTLSDLPDLAAQRTPISQAVKDFYNNNFAFGSGPNGTFLTSDFFGTVSGIPRVPALASVINILQTQIANGTLNQLSLIYRVMRDVVNGVYGDPRWPGTVTIPSGLPGAGTYTGVARLCELPAPVAATSGSSRALTRCCRVSRRVR
jgi:hypothetical protein